MYTYYTPFAVQFIFDMQYILYAMFNQVKQVSPRASVANEQVFWTRHMQVAKHYNTTVRPSTDYWATILKDLKDTLKVTITKFLCLVVIFYFYRSTKYIRYLLGHVNSLL